MVFLKVIISSVVLLILIFAGLGIKLLFGRSKSATIGSCCADDNQFGCSCGANGCAGH
ncbi:MAG: hypothetical protein JXB00_03670 [Bacteroidales bacterium]|nr:hypothetical protein [Bacteroidales bacterium]